jgi:Zinc dependent phospholipase C
MGIRKLVRHVSAVLCFWLLIAPFCSSYSILTHEEIVDVLWKDQIQPLLKKRFPNATEDDLKKAHAFAYGGSMLQDMGYYPFGNKYFSDLVHYVRSGDFVENMIEESSDLNEYAFALGTLAHYVADTTGHPAVNAIVAMEFPKLRNKYGASVNYAQDPKAHIRAEFGLDMVQVAKNRFTSDTYRDFIGFEVSKPVLERAFAKTYGIPITQVFGDLDLAIGSYRRAISKVIPAMTRAALLAHGKQIVKETPNFQKKKFLYNLSRSQYEKQWGKDYQKPGFGTRVLAFILKFVPKVGPFKAVAFQTPSQKGEDMYIKSVNDTVTGYQSTLRATRKDKLDLPNRDFDTGKETRGGEYVLTDKAYARLLDELAKNDFKQVTPDLQSNILAFYANPVAPITTKKDKKAWSKTEEQLAKLKTLSPENLKPAENVQPAESLLPFLPE